MSSTFQITSANIKVGITEDKKVLIFVNFDLDQNIIQLLTLVTFDTYSVETNYALPSIEFYRLSQSLSIDVWMR
jgi:hypothetical protein